MADSGARPTRIEELELAVWPPFAMLAGIQLDVFTQLAQGPMPVGDIAGTLGVRADKLKPLLYALAATGLLKLDGDVCSNTEEASRFLVRGLPSYRGGKHQLLLHNWTAGLSTAETIRTGEPRTRMDFASASEEKLEMFYRSNHGQAMRRGEELVATCDLSGHRTLLDVGGGSGGLSIALAKILPLLQVTIVDLPSVTPITRRIVQEAGLGDRIQITNGDVVEQPLLGAYDAAVMSSFIQVVSADKARRAISHVGAAIVPGGAIYIRGDMIDDSGVSPLATVLRNLVYLNTYDEGQAYTEREHRDWLQEAGFGDFERRILPDGFSLIRARKSG